MEESRHLSGPHVGLILCSLALIAVLSFVYWKNSRTLVVLRPHGTATFYRGGFFHRDQFELTKEGHIWYFFSRSEPFETGELILPFECPYNEYRTLRLDIDGRVYLLNNAKMSRQELRVVNGEWSYDASDHWQSILELD